MHSVEAIEHVNITDRAVAGGWVLPDGWTVQADLTRDDAINDPATEYGEGSAFGPVQVAAWQRDDWAFGVVSVFVSDGHGREWGSSVLGAVVFGDFPDDDGNVTTILPLDDKPAEYSVIREYDMIGEALREAVKSLESFGSPVITEPPGTTVTGL